METLVGLEELPQFVNQLWQQGSSYPVWFWLGRPGAGKTTSIKALLKNLGFNGLVNSPTFSLVNTYQWQADGTIGGVISAASNGTLNTIHHFDLYRLNDFQELENVGFQDYLDSKGSGTEKVFIEWPQMAIPYLNLEDIFCVVLQHNSPQDRTVIAGPLSEVGMGYLSQFPTGAI